MTRIVYGPKKEEKMKFLQLQDIVMEEVPLGL